MSNAITIGHDSEGTLTQHGHVVSALDAFDETVYEDKHGRYFADNMNFEIAINPVTTLADFHSYTQALLDGVRSHGYDLMFEPVVKYSDEALNHPLARISGCNPDTSGYTYDDNVAPDFETSDGTRSCGAHIHAQLSGDPHWWARWMDLLVTLPLLKHETPSNRRSMYGGAGCLRVKPYGGEYRVLSNVWLDDTAKREFVWEMTHKAAELCSTDPSTIEDWWDIPEAIDTHDLVLAQRCIDRLYIYGVTSL